MPFRPVSCTGAEFECLNGDCIFAYWVCDGDAECSDLADEIDCRKYCVLSWSQCSYTNTKTLSCITQNSDIITVLFANSHYVLRTQTETHLLCINCTLKTKNIIHVPTNVVGKTLVLQQAKYEIIQPKESPNKHAT